MKKMGKSKREGERESVCGVTHWVSSRSEGDWLHVMIGDYLWEKIREREKIQGEKEHVGDMKYVGREMDVDG